MGIMTEQSESEPAIVKVQAKMLAILRGDDYEEKYRLLSFIERLSGWQKRKEWEELANGGE